MLYSTAFIPGTRYARTKAPLSKICAVEDDAAPASQRAGRELGDHERVVEKFRLANGAQRPRAHEAEAGIERGVTDDAPHVAFRRAPRGEPPAHECCAHPPPLPRG